jgi:RHS repeat-associated protein
MNANSIYRFLINLCLTCCSFFSFAQINGPTMPSAGINTNYTFDDGSIYAINNWQITNGTVISSTSNGTLYTATVQWTATGPGTLNFRWKKLVVGTIDVIVCGGATPSSPLSYIPSCIFHISGQTTITRQNSPPSGQLWYWQQNDPFGTSTSLGYGASIDVNEGVTMYLRSLEISTGCWSANSLAAAIIPNRPSSTIAGFACTTSAVQLGATLGTNGTELRWYLGCPGSFVGTGASFTTPVLSTTTDYYVSSFNTVTGAESPKLKVPASIFTPPTTPGGTATPASFCGTQSVTLNGSGASGGEVYRWYASASGGSPISNTPSVSATTTFYVSLYNTVTTCEGSRTAVTVTVNPPVTTTPSVAGNARFGVGPLTLVASGTPSGGTYKWYNSANVYQATGLTYTTASVSSSATNYMYVRSVSSAGCDGPQASINITINSLPTVTAPQNFIVKEIPVSLDGGAGYDTYSWKNSSNTVVGTSQVLSTNVPSSYTVTVTKAGVSGAGISSPFIISTSQFNGLNMNYIITEVAQVSGIINQNSMQALSVDKVAQSIGYFDGLGRPIQTISTQGSPLKSDLVSPMVYDQFGRENKKYLPVVTENNGRYKTALFDGTGNYLVNTYNNAADKIADDIRPFSETIFEPSPLNRPDKEYGAGQAWAPSGVGSNNKFIQHTYLINSHGTGSSNTQEKVIAWIVNGSNLPVRASVLTNYVVAGGYYASNQLTIKSTRDEQGNVVREYTDKLGRVILKKVQATTSGAANLNDLTGTTPGWALTYYVYDDLGNLRFVLPPELSKLIHTNADTYAITTTDLNNWAFQYTYDGRKRMITKQVPGAEPVFMVYDDRDRLILTQDGNQRATATKYWSFTKYDELNRPILTGIKDTTVALTQSGMQTAVNNHFAKTSARWGETYIGNVAGNVHGYTNKAYPVRTGASTEIDVNKYLSVTYYDNYLFRDLFYGSYGYLNESLSESANGVVYTQPIIENLRVIGQVTGTKTKVLDGGVTAGYPWLNGYTWLKSVNYYDDKYRVVQNLSDNYKGGTDRFTNVYDFVGKVLKSKSTHIESDVAWKDLVNVKIEGNKLINTSSTTSWGISGAASIQQLGAGQNGWVEYVYQGGNVDGMFGLSDDNTNAHYNMIDYAIYLSIPVVNPNAIVYENGVSKYNLPMQVKVGDVIRIERTGTSIAYKVNGVTQYTSTIASNSLLMADISFHYTGSTITGVRSSFSTTSKTTTRKFEYDHAGRLLKTWHQVDSGPNILLAFNEYNELGQLVDKKLHSTVSTGANAKQSVDYRYNIRGWLTSMNDASLANTTSTTKTNDDTGDLFGMNLAYNETTLGIGNTGLFNGNISGMAWSNNLGLGTTKQNAYTYSYDAMNRILGSAFKEKTASWSAALSNSGLAESGFQYDLNGNIKNLTRNDKRTSGTMDILGYTYTGNQLLKVADTGDKFSGFLDDPTNNATNDYTYDANGNMTRDLNKGIGTSLTDPTNIITYNYLNLPETVTKGNNSIRYIYDAGGRKLSQVTTFGSQQKQTDYVGEYQYENDVLQFISHEEGRIAIASNKTLVTHNGDNTANITAVTSVLAPVTANGANTYVQATASGTTTKQGMFPIGGTLTVAAGEQYRIRAKGYRAATNANMVHLYIRTNSTDLNWPGAQLPSTSTSESYVEQVITIPAGHTTLQAGVVWNTVANGEQFFLNDFEITKLTTNTTPEYQYNLKDHLGNVRLTFTSKDEVDTNTATLETANLNTEQSQFLRIDNAKRINASIFDHTNGSAPTTVTGYAERLNGSANEKYGVAKSISVMPGDVINAEVYAKYVDPTSSNWTGALSTLMSQIAANTAGVVVDGAAYTSSTASFPPGFIGLQTTSNNGAPRAYLNWLVFDRNYGFITGGFKQITTAAKEAGSDVPHELLQMPAPITITQPGYVYIYLSNENPTLVEVYFDDFKVTHTKSPVIQSEDYYPFGLTFNSYQRENAVENKIRFQGQEHVDDMSLGWESFKWRNYMADIGRFFSIDPLSDKYVHNSTYAFAENKLGMGVELEGLELAPFDWLGKSGNQKPSPALGWHPPMTTEHTTTTTTTTATQSTTTTTNTYSGKSTSTTTDRAYDVPGGSNIPNTVSTTDKDGKSSSVSISFYDTESDKHGSDNKISTLAVDGYIRGIKIFAGMMKLNSLVVTATTNGNHSTTVLPLPNWNNPKATTTHYLQNGARGIDTGAVNGVKVLSADSVTLATWRIAMDSAGAYENLGPWTGDKAHQNHFHTSFNK